MAKMTGKQKVAITLASIAILGIGGYLVWKFVIKKGDKQPSESEKQTDTSKGDTTVVNAGDKPIVTTGSPTSGSTPVSTTNPKAGRPGGVPIGKTVYAKIDGVKLFNDASLTSVFRTLKKGEWAGTVTGTAAVGSSVSPNFFVVSGNKLVSMGSVKVG